MFEWYPISGLFTWSNLDGQMHWERARSIFDEPLVGKLQKLLNDEECFFRRSFTGHVYSQLVFRLNEDIFYQPLNIDTMRLKESEEKK